MIEQLDIFDHNKKHIGKANREDAHRLGLWHQTFQCWIVIKEQEQV
ncbi:hypothetical protein [Aquibacillus salsiterrae]|uniref:Uncharacterized protein n=1 Tax=Aquibacillus salsiterrae TaxID=2950439 RepID=A0A9X3WFW6_9BACI|nr:hypothetical protein [Aquibacillus salsiterrae]MDC3417918.1 hypothetical protein [Aquibacillus salsiterrae]